MAQFKSSCDKFKRRSSLQDALSSFNLTICLLFSLCITIILSLFLHFSVVSQQMSYCSKIRKIGKVLCKAFQTTSGLPMPDVWHLRPWQPLSSPFHPISPHSMHSSQTQLPSPTQKLTHRPCRRTDNTELFSLVWWEGLEPSSGVQSARSSKV